MSKTQPPPPRLHVYFAAKAAIGIILRRGPSKRCQMILWHTDTDKFEAGQWIRGNVQHVSVSSDGRYVAYGIMRHPDQHYVVSRPPYFTALEAWINGLCMGQLEFTEDDVLVHPRRGEHIVNARNACPLTRISDDDYRGSTIGLKDRLRKRLRPMPKEPLKDQSGREVLLDAGKVCVWHGAELRVLYDANQAQEQDVPAPDWALFW